MALPNVTESFQDGSSSNTGLTSRRQIKVGVTTSGPLNTRVTCGSLAALLLAFGGGPAVEAAALQGQESGYPVDVIRANGSVSGQIGALIKSGTGSPGFTGPTAAGSNTSTATVTIGGTPPTPPLAVVLKITTAGSNIAAAPKFAFSMDGGLTYSAPITVVAGAIALGSTGITVTWVDGTFVLGDTWLAIGVTGAQVGTATMAPTGSPTDAFQVVLQIVTAGATLSAATAAYVLSLDGGVTWGPATAMPVGGIVTPAGTGLTLTFANGGGSAFAVGDSFSFGTSAPGYNLTDLQNALAGLGTGADDWEFVHVVGALSGSTAAGVQTLMAGYESSHRFVWALCETRDISPEETESTWETSVKGDFAGLWGTAPRVGVAAGWCSIISPITLRTVRRPGAWAAAARLGNLSPGQDIAEVGDGPFTKIQVTALFLDANAFPGMHDAGFICLRTITGLSGFFVADGFTAAGNTSDFYYLVGRRVIDVAARAARVVYLPKLSSSVRVNPAGVAAPYVAGAIYEPDARALDARATSAVNAAVVATGDATSASVSVDRTVVFTATPPPTIPVNVRVTPLGYLRSFKLVVGFQNPNA